MRNLNDLARIAAALNASMSVLYRDAATGRFVRWPYSPTEQAWFRKPLAK